MKVFHLYYQGDEETNDEDLGEIDAMFDENEKLIGTWALNDARWRAEYMNGFMEALGIEVITVGEPTKKMHKQLKKYYGSDMNIKQRALLGAILGDAENSPNTPRGISVK